jgi:hypothetical protein
MPVVLLIAGCGAEEPSGAGVPLESVETVPATEAPSGGSSSTTTSTTRPIEPTTSLSDPSIALAVAFDFPELGLRGNVPDGYELLLEPRQRPAPLEGVTFAHANWGNKELGSVIVVSSAQGLERGSEFSLERRSGVEQIAERSDGEPVYRFVDPGGSVEIFWRLADGTTVAVVGTNVDDETVLRAVAETLKPTSDDREVES